jgi:hypothetical protein
MSSDYDFVAAVARNHEQNPNRQQPQIEPSDQDALADQSAFAPKINSVMPSD